ncbi:hypothetical protein [Serratia fonticola]
MTISTKQLTNEELRQIIDSHEKGYGMCVPVNCDYLMAKELLAVREAQSGWTNNGLANSALVMLDRIDTLDTDDDERIEEVKRIVRLLSVPPAPAVQSDVEAVLALLEAGEWAEHCTKTELGQRLEASITSMVGNMHPLPPDAVVAAVTKGMERYNGAMLYLAGNSGIQAIPDGYKLMPIEMTDEIGEAIAMEANCCGGIALDIYNAALAAAPTPTK